MRKTKRWIKNELEELKGGPVGDVTVYSDVVTVTEDMIGDHGSLVDEEISKPEPPEGYTLGDEIPTQSPVVTWYRLIPIGQ